jgi:hypothetical protein
MSRGLGKLQRDLLENLEEGDKALDTITLTADAYRVEPDANGCRGVTDAQHAAVRRALCGLQKRGLVVDLMRCRHRDNRRYWASLKTGLPARLNILQQLRRGDPEIAAIQERMNQLGISPAK